MCGIAGIFAFEPKADRVCPRELLRIRDAMRSRGPDGDGFWIDEEKKLGLAHRRLSIIDLSARAAQPMWTSDRRYAIVFNGEIYNYRALRESLIRQGFAFQSESDTEVVLNLYRNVGEEMVHQLRGMFAFAIWDAANEHLFLARDPYGIKPLYYSTRAGSFRFASQARALIAGGAVSEAPDPAGWVGFYLHGSVPEPFTTYRAIRNLPAGSTLLVDARGVARPKSFHSIAAVYAAAEQAADDAQSASSLRDALIDSVRHHLVADVPVGCFLSAGIDSCTLLALMRESTDAHIKAVTLGFGEFSGSSEDEVPLAAIAARTYDAEHHVRIVDHSEFRADIDKIISAMDQPSIDGINSYFVSKAARELGLKVAVSGLGGDELFGGYPTFKDVPTWVRACAPFTAIPGAGLASRFAIAAAQRVHPFGSPKMASMLEYGGTSAGSYFLHRGLFMPWELGRFLNRDFLSEGLETLAPLERINEALKPDPGSDFARVAALEAQIYMRNQLLRDVDWASMAHSLEVRVPFVDHTLLSRIACTRPHPRKVDLAQTPQRPLPNAIAGRVKTGFFTPIGRWLDASSQENFGDDRSTDKLRGGQTSRKWAHELVRRWPTANTPAVTTIATTRP